MDDLERLIEIRKEILIRECREDLLAFTIYTKDDYQIGWHHRQLANKLNAFARGEIRFLMVFMPPRHGKSELVSRRFPAWLHGLYPDAEIMAASYLDSLAGDMTIDVQNIIDSPRYKEIFPETKIWPPGTSYTKGTRNSSEHHIVGRRGKYRGQGVGGSFTGKGANFIIVDDPIKGREIADSLAFRERLWKFYLDDLYSRLETNLETGRLGQILITQCMTGDTSVMMADGTETALRDIRIGDAIATYDDGQISVSTVKNWKCCGPDLIFAIRTSSGIIVKANERHPFLVCRNGKFEWVRLRDLKLNDKMIRVGENGKEKIALSMDVKNRQSAKDFACPITINKNGQQDTDLHPSIQIRADLHTCDNAMVLNDTNTIRNLSNKMVIAPSVKQKGRAQIIGDKNSALIMTMSQGKSEDCSVTNATLSSDMETMKRFCSTLPIIYDHIVDISEIGTEDVFDIQIERTENFIANGLVSHNTRWHEDDLSGRLIELMKKDEHAVQWEIIRYPAIRVDMDDPTDTRPIGGSLWPEKYDIPQLNQIKATAGPRGWSSLYQQNPVPDGGGLFKDRMFRFVDCPTLFDYRFITADTAYKEKQENDFSVFSHWGVIGDQLYLIGCWREQIKAVDLEYAVEPFIRSSMNYGYRETLIEPKGHGIYLNQAFIKKGLMIPDDETLKEFYSDRRLDKVERAGNVAPHLSNRFIGINNCLANKEELVTECLGFPKGKHDDFVDTMIDALKRVYNKELCSLDYL